MTENTSTPAPVDPESAAALATNGLELTLLDPVTGTEQVRRWILAESRGFHEPEPSDERLAGQAAEIAADRMSAVWDATAADPETPVATIRSWVMGLTVPGGAALPAWAISSVTVSPTHRRRGIARALLGGELREAARAGLAMAMLTVSEATIYARYGFGPAVHQADYLIDSTRAHWTGPTPAGRVQFVSPESLLVDGQALFDRARPLSPGEVDRRPNIWADKLGLNPRHPGATTKDLRAVRFDDADGVPQGFALYTVAIIDNSFPARLTLTDLVAATGDASAALWRFLLEMDLVTEITAPHRSVSEPVSWQISDRRAVRKVDESDHLWLRILDVPAALAARTYAAADDFVLEVTDDLGFAAGRFAFSTTPTSTTTDAAGRAHPLPATADPAIDTPAAALALTVADLGSLYLGGASAVELVRAGRVRELTPGAAARFDAVMRTQLPPFLSTGF
ncbi:GNAT family N-acetyltransferase [Cryobacterium melibiosiphilum]|uniref:GNAT family N-acetyltransferase n=1 Tax=Cryobacterium melibiosiphilum TaxID=995039 RepID=A0A3A5MA86_9MICO|nr:GNAT family N-acetyltransferase [Cryobacterium melibiosiphilum]RJT85275.1 GNAT family N-acetyltransferase [Cryobacterium melibiosiphilum]